MTVVLEHTHDHTISRDSSHDHVHSHDSGAAHSHPPAAGAEGPPKGGPVVVDIGGEVGALIAHLDDRLWGEELFLRPTADPSTPDAVVAVFPALVEGRYAVLDGAGTPTTEILITGGVVTELDLRTEPPAA